MGALKGMQPSQSPIEDFKSATEKLKETDPLDYEVPNRVMEDIKRMLVNYRDVQVRNMDDQLKESLPVDSRAASIFDPLLMP